MPIYDIVQYIPYTALGIVVSVRTQAGIEFVQINFPRYGEPQTVDVYYSGMLNDEVELVSIIFSGE